MKELSIEIPFGATDSELCDWEYTIPEGMEATIVDNKIVVKKKPTDKVGSKFREGEWLCENEPNNYARFIQILEIVNVQGKDKYRISRDIHKDEDVVEFGFVEKHYHKFDIQDAKDGDVLATGNRNIFIFKSISGYTIYDYCGLYFGKFEEDPATVNGTFAVQLPIDYVPATKEQRDLLFQKMREAGYQWDEEKKELKKIEQNPTDEEMKELLHTEYEKGRADATAEMQKPVEWSEEDEKIYNVVHDLAWESYKTSRRLDIPTFGIINDWLKSLKERYTWKPSEEQIAALTDAVNYWNKSGCYSSDLVQLLTDLKKLKGK